MQSEHAMQASWKSMGSSKGPSICFMTLREQADTAAQMPSAGLHFSGLQIPRSIRAAELFPFGMWVVPLRPGAGVARSG